MKVTTSFALAAAALLAVSTEFVAGKHHHGHHNSKRGKCSASKQKHLTVDKPQQQQQEQQQPAKQQESKSATIAPVVDSIGAGGLFGFSTKQCGKSGATEKTTKTSGPNGDQYFLNCGLYDGGWTPPDITIDMIKAIPLDEAINDPNSPFKPCAPYVDIFDREAANTGLPPILIASIAMQESTCNPNVRGGGGEYGMMQITQDKCTEGIDCLDVSYNIKTGAAYLKSRLDANNGNVLLMLGEYNGWSAGLTVAKATAVKGSCCKCQNNLNYMQQMLNGWFQNLAGYDLGDWSMGC